MEEAINPEDFGIATKKGNNALMDEIGNIIKDMQTSGKLEEIENKWI